jgi:hypothetical protein
MIGCDSLHYFIIFRVQMFKKRLKTNLINKLSYIYIFNMIKKLRSYEDFIKKELRK